MGGCEADGKLSAGSLSPDNNGRSAAWWLYQGISTGPLVWTCEIDGSSSFSVGGVNGYKYSRGMKALDVGLEHVQRSSEEVKVLFFVCLPSSFSCSGVRNQCLKSACKSCRRRSLKRKEEI